MVVTTPLGSFAFHHTESLALVNFASHHAVVNQLIGNLLKPFKDHKEIAMARVVAARVATSATTLENELQCTTRNVKWKRLTEPFPDVCCGVHVCAMLVWLLMFDDVVYR